MAGSELYVSEMLEKFEENMTKSMENLAASMEGMAESMAASTSAMAEIVNNTSLSISTFRVVASDNVKITNEEEVLYTCQSKKGNYSSGHTTDIPLYKSMASGSIKFKFKSSVKSGTSSYVWFANSQLLLNDTAIYTISESGNLNFEKVLDISEGDVLSLRTVIKNNINTDQNVIIAVQPHNLAIGYDILNPIQDGAFIKL